MAAISKNFDNSSRQFCNIYLSPSLPSPFSFSLLFLPFSFLLFLGVTKLTDIFRRNTRYRQRIRGNQREIDTILPLRLKPGKTGNYRRMIYPTTWRSSLISPEGLRGWSRNEIGHFAFKTPTRRTKTIAETRVSGSTRGSRGRIVSLFSFPPHPLRIRFSSLFLSLLFPFSLSFSSHPCQSVPPPLSLSHSRALPLVSDTPSYPFDPSRAHISGGFYLSLREKTTDRYNRKRAIVAVVSFECQRCASRDKWPSWPARIPGYSKNTVIGGNYSRAASPRYKKLMWNCYHYSK